MAKVVQNRFEKMLWYTDELLRLAKELGYLLLPAFNTTTGLPYARVNLLHGMTNELKVLNLMIKGK